MGNAEYMGVPRKRSKNRRKFRKRSRRSSRRPKSHTKRQSKRQARQLKSKLRSNCTRIANVMVSRTRKAMEVHAKTMDGGCHGAMCPPNARTVLHTQEGSSNGFPDATNRQR